MSKSSHSFSVDIAAQEGLIEAILLQHIHILQTSFLERDQDPDTSWVRRSVRAYHITYPYLTDKKISGALDRMEERDLIRSKIQNKVSYDRTKSVQLAQKGWAYFRGNAFDKRENGKDEKGNGIDQMGESLQGSYIPFVDSFVERENTPARAEISETVEAEKSPQPPKVAAKGSAPARPIPEAAPPPTHIVKTIGPDSNGVIEAEGISLVPLGSHPNANSPKDLKAALIRYSTEYPDNWRDNVLEVGRATNWTDEKIGECLTDFCAYQFKLDNTRAKFTQYTAGFSLWLKGQTMFDKPGASSTTTPQSSKAHLNRLGADEAHYHEPALF